MKDKIIKIFKKSYFIKTTYLFILKQSQNLKGLFRYSLSIFPFLSYFFYFVFWEFKDEKKAVFFGINENKKSISKANFIRNIHRIEKGIITNPRKKVFAESYIYQLIKHYIYFSNLKEDVRLVNWSTDVLNEYFSIVDIQSSDDIRKAFRLFDTNKSPKSDNIMKPYKSSMRPELTVSYDDFLKLNIRRRSIRGYEDREIEEEILNKAFKAALYSPSACNRQPFSFHVVSKSNEELFDKLIELPIGATTFKNNIPVMIYVIGDLSNYFSERDKHLIYIDGALVVMNFVLALETLGLSSCIINWPDLKYQNKRINKILKLNKWERCVTTISVGYAKNNEGVPYSSKKEPSEVVKYY